MERHGTLNSPRDAPERLQTMSKTSTGYHFHQEIAANGQKATTHDFIADDLRQGLDHAMARAEQAAPGLGKAIGVGFRPIVEGGGAAALKEGVPHSASGKCPNGTGTVKVTAMPKL